MRSTYYACRIFFYFFSYHLKEIEDVRLETTIYVFLFSQFKQRLLVCIIESCCSKSGMIEFTKGISLVLGFYCCGNDLV